jgi:uncharacterized protein
MRHSFFVIMTICCLNLEPMYASELPSTSYTFKPINPKSSFSGDLRISFFLASKKGELGTVLDCLRREIDPNICDQHGQTALMLASFYGHSKIVELLLEKGSDETMVDKQGKTALIFAVEGTNPDVVAKIILDHREQWDIFSFLGEYVNHTDKKGNTALTIAHRLNLNNIVKTLLYNGGNIITQDI